MKLNKIIKTIIPFMFLLLMSTTAFADPTDPDEGEEDAEAPLDPAPIGDYLIPMLVLGVATAFVLLRKRNTAKV